MLKRFRSAGVEGVMSDINFSCSACGQHIVCVSEISGQRTACPTCQREIRIPFANEKRPNSVQWGTPVPPLLASCCGDVAFASVSTTGTTDADPAGAGARKPRMCPRCKGTAITSKVPVAVQIVYFVGCSVIALIVTVIGFSAFPQLREFPKGMVYGAAFILTRLQMNPKPSDHSCSICGKNWTRFD